jgi:hypothetical protein
MPSLHDFNESLNDQAVTWKHTAKIQILIFPTLLNVAFQTKCLRGELKRNKTGAERGGVGDPPR